MKTNLGREVRRWTGPDGSSRSSASGSRTSSWSAVGGRASRRPQIAGSDREHHIARGGDRCSTSIDRSGHLHHLKFVEALSALSRHVPADMRVGGTLDEQVDSPLRTRRDPVGPEHAPQKPASSRLQRDSLPDFPPLCCRMPDLLPVGAGGGYETVATSKRQHERKHHQQSYQGGDLPCKSNPATPPARTRPSSSPATCGLTPSPCHTLTTNG
jgi:hypothetical protein